MQKILKEVKTFKDCFVATDGTEFMSEQECKEYEKTCACVINTRFKAIAKEIDWGYSDLDELWDNANACTNYYLVIPKTDTDINTILAYVKQNGGNPHAKDISTSLEVDTSEIEIGQPYFVTDSDYYSAILSAKSLRRYHEHLLNNIDLIATKNTEGETK